MLDPDIEDWVPSIHLGDIWIAADSRISKPVNSGGLVIPTDAALKILPIDLKLYREHDDGPGSYPVFEAQLAYAFAGNILPATMTYSMAVSYLRGMTGPSYANLPTIGDIVGMINRMGNTYAAETRLPFEAFVVGVCPLHQSNRRDHAYKLRFDGSGTLINPKLIDLSPTGSFELLGSYQKEIGAIITAGMAAKFDYNPALAIKSVIEEQISGDIGGYLHLARIRNGVDIYPGWRGDKGDLPSPYSDSRLGHVGDWKANGIFGVS